jgi:hypothetical protein
VELKGEEEIDGVNEESLSNNEILLVKLIAEEGDGLDEEPSLNN